MVRTAIESPIVRFKVGMRILSSPDPLGQARLCFDVDCEGYNMAGLCMLKFLVGETR
jgi:hypothetical protein